MNSWLETHFITDIEDFSNKDCNWIVDIQFETSEVKEKTPFYLDI